MTEQERIRKYIPKKYQNEVACFYHDEDGWWLELKEESPYWFNPCGYGTEYTIHEDTIKEVINNFKWYIELRPGFSKEG